MLVALAQGRPAVLDCASVRRLVLPPHRSAAAKLLDVPALDCGRRTVVEGLPHDVDAVLVPGKGAEEKAGRDANPAAEVDADREARAHGVAGPRRPAHRRIRRPPPAAVDQQRVVIGDVNHERIGVFDVDDAALPRDQQRVVAAEVARRERALAQALDRVHHVGLLLEEGLAQVLGPVEPLAHHPDHARERDQRLDARIPVLVLDRAHRLVALKPRVALRPARRLDHLEGIGRSHQDLRQQRVGIERNRRQHLVQLRLRIALCRRRLGERGRRRHEERQEGEYPSKEACSHDRCPLSKGYQTLTCAAAY